MTNQTFDLIRAISAALDRDASTVDLPISKAIYGDLATAISCATDLNAETISAQDSPEYRTACIGRSPSQTLQQSCCIFLDHLIARLSANNGTPPL
jgi:hypothetical protein